jgi:hypothetical protein
LLHHIRCSKSNNMLAAVFSCVCKRKLLHSSVCLAVLAY